MLEELASQTVRPSDVVVVDGGMQPVEPLLRRVWPMPVRYAHVQPPGLARQQNVGLTLVPQHATLVGFLDDDITLEPDALEAMLAFWRSARPDVGGAGFNIVSNTEPPRGLWLKSRFGMDSAHRGVVLPSGYQTKIGAVDATCAVDWLYGGATVWRRLAIEGLQFDERFDGPGHLYDVDFSFCVAQRARLVIVSGARVQELDRNRHWDDYALGRWQVINRLYLVRKHRGRPGLSLGRCIIALVGQTLMNLARGIGCDRRYLNRAAGNVRGCLEELGLGGAPGGLRGVPGAASVGRVR